MGRRKIATALYVAGAGCGAAYGFGAGQGLAFVACVLVIAALLIVRKDI